MVYEQGVGPKVSWLLFESHYTFCLNLHEIVVFI
jgi:hypothetical protein